jgi:subtilisin family serine protease
MFCFAFLLTISLTASAATIGIIDTGFDLDHAFLRPKIFKHETDEESVDAKLASKFDGWDFNDNSHLKKAVIEDQSALQEVLLYRNLKAKGHREGLTPGEFEWFSKKNNDKGFLKLAKQFKKHAHGTFVAGIALREGENINIFPVRGLNIPSPVVAVDAGSDAIAPVSGRNPEEKFKAEINNSLDRVSKKFSRICYYLSLKNVQVVNASYGITYKNIMTRFQEQYKEITSAEIDGWRLKQYVDGYFNELYRRGERTIAHYPQMLFVFSAGNSGLDNDQFHHYPSRIKLPNTLAVAAANGEYLASFSNYGLKSVDIAAPGVAILSLVPKVYSKDGNDIYSPSSGTSMAAPYISNLAAQLMNANSKLGPAEIKQIILQTGDENGHIRGKLISGAIANNQKAVKAALLSKDMKLAEAINLAKLDIIPMEDKISFGLGPAITPEKLQKKMMESIPAVITPDEVDDEPEVEAMPTKPASFSPMDQETKKPDTQVLPSSALPSLPAPLSNPDPSSPK